MPKHHSLYSAAGLSLACVLPLLFLSGCSVFKSKEERAAAKASKLFRQDGAEREGSTNVAGNTNGNPKWKRDIDENLTRGRESVPGNNARTRPSGPPPRNPNTNVRVDLAAAKATTYHSVNTGGPHIALTFDDGPHAKNTPRLLDMLKARNIKATFFVVGPNAKRYPGIMKRIVAEGHEVGNHTMTHGNLAQMSNASIKKELDGCRDAIIQSCGVNPRVMRAPYGALKNAQKVYIKNTWGYPNIHWSVDPEDWKKPGPSVVANRITSRTKSGGIVLVHDIHAASIVAMPQALDGLLRKGFRFVTTSQLISLGNRTAAAEEAALEKENEVTAAAEESTGGEPTPAVPLPSTEEAGQGSHARIEE